MGVLIKVGISDHKEWKREYFVKTSENCNTLLHWGYNRVYPL